MECLCSNNSKKDFPNPVILYDNINPKVRSVLMVMNRLNVRIPLRFIDTLAGEHMTEAYKRINPASTVPTLIDNDLVLFTSPAILVHLASNYNGTDLYPCEFDTQMRIMNMLFFDLSVLYRRHGAYMTALIRSEDKEKLDEFYGQRILESYEVLEKILGNSKHMVSEKISLADYGIMGTMTGLNLIFPVKNYSAEFPRLFRWFISMTMLPEYSKEVITGVEKERMFIENMVKSNRSIGANSIISQDVSSINESIGKNKNYSREKDKNFGDTSEYENRNIIGKNNQFKEFLDSSSVASQISETKSHEIDYYNTLDNKKTKSENSIYSCMNQLCKYSKKPDALSGKIPSCKCSCNRSLWPDVEKSFINGKRSSSENSYSNANIFPMKSSLEKISKDSLPTSSNLRAPNAQQENQKIPTDGTMAHRMLGEESDSESIKQEQSTDVGQKLINKDRVKLKCGCIKKNPVQSGTTSQPIGSNSSLNNNKIKNHDRQNLFSGNTEYSSSSNEFQTIKTNKSNSKTLHLKSNCPTCSRCKFRISNYNERYNDRSDVNAFHNYNDLYCSNNKLNEDVTDIKKSYKQSCNNSWCLPLKDIGSNEVSASDLKKCLKRSLDCTNIPQHRQSTCSSKHNQENLKGPKDCTKPEIGKKKQEAFIYKKNVCRNEQNCQCQNDKFKHTITKLTSGQDDHKLTNNVMNDSNLYCICSSIGCLSRTKNKMEILREERRICKEESNVDEACPGCQWILEIMLQHFEKNKNLCNFYENLSIYSNDASNEQCCSCIKRILGHLQNIKK